MKIIFILFVSLILTIKVNAQHVLPYPGPLPGNKLYKIIQIIDKLQKFWYWGNLAQFKYNLNQSDKYLVEAKTLFEYSQYLLAVQALKRSDEAFSVLPEFITKAQAEGKDITEIQSQYILAANKHTEVLQQLMNDLPENYIWSPEKSKPTELNLYALLNESTALRKKRL